MPLCHATVNDLRDVCIPPRESVLGVLLGIWLLDSTKERGGVEVCNGILLGICKRIYVGHEWAEMMWVAVSVVCCPW